MILKNISILQTSEHLGYWTCKAHMHKLYFRLLSNALKSVNPALTEK